MKLFIAGTGTEVGKTRVAACLAAYAASSGHQVTYYKPIQTGCLPHAADSDEAEVSRLSNGKVKVVTRYFFPDPAAPLAADPHGKLDVSVIKADIASLSQHTDLLLIEGAGGLFVPLTADTLTIDLIAALDVPVVLVAHSQLGTINHTLLSVEALQHREIPLSGLVMNFYPDNTTATVAEKTLLPTTTPFLPEDLPIWTLPKAPATALSTHPMLKTLLASLTVAPATL